MYVRILILGGSRLGYCKNQPLCVIILDNSRWIIAITGPYAYPADINPLKKEY
jgi:hypothetical protein